MSYVSYEYYIFLYGSDSIPESDFNRISWEAEREIDKSTTGIDNIRKLRSAFPVDEYDAETVKRCVCNLIRTMYQIDVMSKSMEAGIGYEKTEGGMRGKVISSVSAGNESVTYGNGLSMQSTIGKAVFDARERGRIYREIVSDALSGNKDANGVNLLYMGKYPCKYNL